MLSKLIGNQTLTEDVTMSYSVLKYRFSDCCWGWGFVPQTQHCPTLWSWQWCHCSSSLCFHLKSSFFVPMPQCFIPVCTSLSFCVASDPASVLEDSRYGLGINDIQLPLLKTLVFQPFYLKSCTNFFQMLPLSFISLSVLSFYFPRQFTRFFPHGWDLWWLRHMVRYSICKLNLHRAFILRKNNS